MEVEKQWFARGVFTYKDSPNVVHRLSPGFTGVDKRDIIIQANKLMITFNMAAIVLVISCISTIDLSSIGEGKFERIDEEDELTVLGPIDTDKFDIDIKMLETKAKEL